jgi:hypothetical protein
MGRPDRRGHHAQTNVAGGGASSVSAGRSDPVTQTIALVKRVRIAPPHLCWALVEPRDAVG